MALKLDGIGRSPGLMETHLTYDNRCKQLGVLVRQRLTTSDNLQLKVKFQKNIDG